MKASDQALKKFISANGKRELVIYKRADGFFYFEDSCEDTEDLRAFGLADEIF